MSSEVEKLVWVLARRHTWGSPIPEEHLIDTASDDEDYDVMLRALENEASGLPFVAKGPDGYYIPNGQDKHVQAANWLLENTNLSTIQIGPTLSRLPEDWPE